MKLRIVSLLPAFIWFIIIFILLTLPGKDLPKEDFLSAIYFDKWVHAGLFGTLVFLFSYPYRHIIAYKKSFYLVIVVMAIIYGVAMEYVQKYFTVDRDFDVNDMVADAVGAVLGYIFFRMVIRKMKQKISPCRNRGRNQN